MNLVEAIKSKMNFRRISWNGKSGWLYNNPTITNCNFTVEEIIADDWEVQAPTVTITKSQFLNAVADTMKEMSIKDGYQFLGPSGFSNRPCDVEGFKGWSELMKALGL